MPKKVHLVESCPSKKIVSADVVVDAPEDVTVEWCLDDSYIFARKSATVNPPYTTVKQRYTVTGMSDPHLVKARAGSVVSASTSLKLGGQPKNLNSCQEGQGGLRLPLDPYT